MRSFTTACGAPPTPPADFNDIPRLLEAISGAGVIVQDCCLKGGATFEKLLDHGSGVAKKFATPNAQRADGSHDVGAPTVRALPSRRAAAVVTDSQSGGLES